MLLLIFLASLSVDVYASSWIEYSDSGTATVTHNLFPESYVGSCGCTGDSTKYPIAALSQMAYGSSRSYGSACGKCFKLTLVNPVVATPPFYPAEVKSVVIKVIDLCPLSNIGWCSAMSQKPNKAGAYLNFDLSYPSKALPDDFFPSNETLYGYKDFGVWNINYEVVSCLSEWDGAKNEAALGSVAALGNAACCPADPQPGNASNICPSFSDQNGLPPDTRTGAAMRLSSYTFCNFLPIAMATLLWIIFR